MTVVAGIEEHELAVDGDTESSPSEVVLFLLPFFPLLSITRTPLLAPFNVGEVMTATLEWETVYLCLLRSPLPVNSTADAMGAAVVPLRRVAAAPLRLSLFTLVDPFRLAGNLCSVVV